MTVDTEKFCSCRLINDEIDYLDEYWKGKFSDYVHSCFKSDMAKTKNNKKKNNIENFSRNVILLGLGAIFILFSFNLSSLLVTIVVFLLGVFFMITSLFSIFIEVKNAWKSS